MGEVQDSLNKEDRDWETLYQQHCAVTRVGNRIIVQGNDGVGVFSKLFYVAVKVNGKETLLGMLDSGSMSSTISNTYVERLQAFYHKRQSEENIVLIGCGGQLTQPAGIYDLELELYGTRCIVPTLVVAGQSLDLIVGSNVIKYLLRSMRSSSEYWDLTSRQNRSEEQHV